MFFLSPNAPLKSHNPNVVGNWVRKHNVSKATLHILDCTVETVS